MAEQQPMLRGRWSRRPPLRRRSAAAPRAGERDKEQQQRVDECNWRIELARNAEKELSETELHTLMLFYRGNPFLRNNSQSNTTYIYIDPEVQIHERHLTQRGEGIEDGDTSEEDCDPDEVM